MYSYDSSSGEDNDDELSYFENNMNKNEYLSNQKELFQKDTYKKYLYIDTNNIQTENLNTSNFIYDMTNVTNDNHNLSVNKENDIIGFNLLRGNIPNITYVINSTNNKIKYTVDGNDIELTLDKGNYSYSTLPDSITNGAYLYIPNTGTVSASLMISAVHSGDTKNIYTIKNASEISFKIDWEYSKITKKASRCFGFRPITKINSAISHVSEISPDLDNHFVDIIIDEIPTIACQTNNRSLHMIDRIYLDNKINKLYNYLSESQNENYFYPISLNKLSIKLYDDMGNEYDTNNKNISLGFELTILNNKKMIE